MMPASGNEVASAGRVMFSAAEESFGSAVRELRAEFGSNLRIERAGPDLGIIASPPPTVVEVAQACLRRPLVFIRHLTVEVARVRRPEATDIKTVVAAARSVVADRVPDAGLAVQTWVSGAAQVGYGSGDLYRELARELTDAGVSVSRAGKQLILSCCITPAGVSIGLNLASESLSDWPGGRIRLIREDAQISRAEFKLEELLKTFPIHLPQGGRAVDLGASPGGWTRILRQHGLTVWAIDPADLDPRIAADPRVHHVRTTAGEFIRLNDGRFDLAVNDMRMDPERSCRVMLDASPLLRPGAIAIVTLKIGTHRAVESVRRCLDILSEAYQVVHARQLHHNRHEVTVVARRKGTAAVP